MHDLRFERLADIMLEHSLQVKAGDAFHILADVAAIPLVKVILQKAKKLGVLASVDLISQDVNRQLLELYNPQDGGITEQFLKQNTAVNIARFQNLVGQIVIRSYPNDQELSGIPAEIRQLDARMARPYRDLVINHRKWVLFEYPTPAQAQRAGMAFDPYADFVLDVCCVDYDAMQKNVRPLADLMQRTDQVHLISPGTDLRFSIRDIPAIPCSGECNLPDGECFTAPVRESIDGFITFNAPSIYWGTLFQGIYFRFEQGRIVEAHAEQHTEMLNRILDSDAGARYIGEFSLGFNPMVRKPFCNTLFDEKICGSFHLTPGSCYDEAPNGNQSTIHWDLVQIQRPDYGGGEIWFDGRLIRKDGQFVRPELLLLNDR